MKYKEFKSGVTAGVFDLFHIGHFRMLKSAAAQCGYLTIGVEGDNTPRIKKEGVIQSQAERVAILEEVKFAAEIVVYLDVYDFITSREMDVLFVGGDQHRNAKVKRAIDYCRKKGIAVVQIPRTSGISTTEIKNRVRRTLEK